MTDWMAAFLPDSILGLPWYRAHIKNPLLQIRIRTEHLIANQYTRKE